MNTLSYRIKVRAKNFSKEKILTTPTVVTLIGFISIFIYILQFSHSVLVTLIPFTVFIAVLSDVVDGPLARRLKQKTLFGRLIDASRDRFILIAGATNILIVKNETIYVFIFVFILISEVVSFLKRDYLDYKEKRINTENQFIRICYAFAFFAIFLMTVKIYWQIDFLPSVWIFLSIITLTSLFGLIEAIYK
jgi:phosphatidylglycerophosphate synthase